MTASAYSLEVKGKDFSTFPHFLVEMGLQDEMRTRIWLAAIIFYSPVRLRPVIGVMTGAHYRTLLMFFISPHKLKICGGPADKEKLCVDACIKVLVSITRLACRRCFARR